jgi:hypothetical protein
MSDKKDTKFLRAYDSNKTVENILYSNCELVGIASSSTDNISLSSTTKPDNDLPWYLSLAPKNMSYGEAKKFAPS